MNFEFHYYGTYAAARLAGWTAAQAGVIAHAAQYVDDCCKKRLVHINNPVPTVHTLLSLAVHDILWDNDFQREITRVWPVFHFLPGNFNGQGQALQPYQGAAEHHSTLSDWTWDNDSQLQYPYVCQPNNPILKRMIDALAQQQNPSLHAVGLAMHVLADTWAHMRYAGLPGWFMNTGAISDKVPEPIFAAVASPPKGDQEYENGDDEEPDEDIARWRDVLAAHRAGKKPTQKEKVAPGKGGSKVTGDRSDMMEIWERILDEEGQVRELSADDMANLMALEDYVAYNSYILLGHGRSGHTPDYPYQDYNYLPQWRSQAPEPRRLHKNNPQDFRLAFLQMIQAMSDIRNQSLFTLCQYAPISEHNDDALNSILTGAAGQRISAQSVCWRNGMGQMQVAPHTPMEVPGAYDARAWARAARDVHNAGGDVNDTDAGLFNQAALAHLTLVREVLAAHHMNLDTVPI